MSNGAGPRDYAVFEAELSGQILNTRLLGRVLGWLRPYRATLGASALLVLVASALQVLQPVVISLVVVDHIILGTANQGVYQAPDMGLTALTENLASILQVPPLVAGCLLYALLTIGAAGTGHLHRLLLASAVVKGLRDLRQHLFAHIEQRPASFFDHVQSGRVMTRVTNDVEALYELLRGLGSLVGEFVPFFVALALMLAVDVDLTLQVLLALPIMVVATFYFRRATRWLFRKVRLSVSALNQHLQENLAGLSVVQLSRREQRNLAHYMEINEENRSLEQQSMRFETFYGAFNDSMAAVALAVILWYGGGSVIQEQISLGGLILFTRFIDMLFHPVVALGEQTNVLFRAMASGERIFQALDWNESIHEPAQPVTLPTRLRGEVEFRNLSFAYDPAQPVLRNVSFRVPAGKKLAIVGPTGSGKSTIIRLLGRCYDFERDSILLDGIDLQDIASTDVRRRIGVVLQDFHIFSGTIADNIALSNPAIDRDRVVAAARTVNAHDFISSLPHGYDTLLAERGQNLSQGQRQLLAFARVLAADPEILVLDEATASIDTETELLIQDALAKLTEGRTSILIAHRLQTIREADRILVLRHGRVEEYGSHQDLVTAGGLYQTLHELQFQLDHESPEIRFDHQR